MIAKTLGRTPYCLGLDALLVNKRYQISESPHVHVVGIHILKGNFELSPREYDARRRKHDRNAFQTGGNNLSDSTTKTVAREQEFVPLIVRVCDDGAVDVVGW